MRCCFGSLDNKKESEGVFLEIGFAKTLNKKIIF